MFLIVKPPSDFDKKMGNVYYIHHPFNKVDTLNNIMHPHKNSLVQGF